MKKKIVLIGLMVLLVVANVVLIGQIRTIYERGKRVESMPLNETGAVTDPIHVGQDEMIQTFFAVLDDISGVEIWLAPGTDTSVAEISLYDNSTGVYYFAPREVTLRDGRIVLDLDSHIQGRSGNEFYLKIVPIRSDGGIQFRSTQGNYPDNHLLINGSELESDIAMTQYTPPDATLEFLTILTAFLPVDLFCCYEIISAFRARGKEK